MVSESRTTRGLYWDQALSLVEGCTPVDETCLHCWSARQTHMRACQDSPAMKARYGGLTDADGRWTGRVRFMGDDLDKPMRARKPRVWSVWNDLFHEDMKEGQIDAAMAMMLACDRHTFLVLTKRVGRLVDYLHGVPRTARALPASYGHVWWGATAGTQEHTHRLDTLSEVAYRWGGNTFASLEPLLGPIAPGPWLDTLRGVIAGGESGGREARPCRPLWVASLLEHCRLRGVPAFVKQMGTHWARNKLVATEGLGATTVYRLGDRKGVRMEHWPESLRVRELAW